MLYKLFNMFKRNTNKDNDIRNILINSVVSDSENICVSDINKYIGMISINKDSYWLLSQDEHDDITKSLNVLDIKIFVLHTSDDNHMIYIATTKENRDALKIIFSKYFNIVNILNDCEVLKALETFDDNVKEV